MPGFIENRLMRNCLEAFEAQGGYGTPIRGTTTHRGASKHRRKKSNTTRREKATNLWSGGNYSILLRRNRLALFFSSFQRSVLSIVNSRLNS